MQSENKKRTRNYFAYSAKGRYFGGVISTWCNVQIRIGLQITERSIPFADLLFDQRLRPGRTDVTKTRTRFELHQHCRNFESFQHQGQTWLHNSTSSNR